MAPSMTLFIAFAPASVLGWSLGYLTVASRSPSRTIWCIRCTFLQEQFPNSQMKGRALQLLWMQTLTAVGLPPTQAKLPD